MCSAVSVVEVAAGRSTEPADNTTQHSRKYVSTDVVATSAYVLIHVHLNHDVVRP